MAFIASALSAERDIRLMALAAVAIANYLIATRAAFMQLTRVILKPCAGK